MHLKTPEPVGGFLLILPLSLAPVGDDGLRTNSVGDSSSALVELTTELSTKACVVTLALHYSGEIELADEDLDAVLRSCPDGSELCTPGQCCCGGPGEPMCCDGTCTTYCVEEGTCCDCEGTDW